VVIGMAVTTGGLPVRLWVWPGNTGDTTVLAEVKTDLAGWRLNRTLWVVDAGFASGDNRKGGFGYERGGLRRSAQEPCEDAGV
jgi:transposase